MVQTPYRSYKLLYKIASTRHHTISPPPHSSMSALLYLRQARLGLFYSSSFRNPDSLEEIEGKLAILVASQALIKNEWHLVEKLRLAHLRKTSAFRRIPTEVFDVIFGEVALGTALHRTTHRYTLALSHTCTWWRTLTLNRPRLWSTFALDLGPWYYHPFLIDLYLLRSNTSPLCIEVHLSDDDDYTSQNLESFFSKSAQWIESLTINAPMWNHALNQIIRNCSFPSTKMLEIKGVLHCDLLERWEVGTMPSLIHFRFAVGRVPHKILSSGKLICIELDISNHDFHSFLSGCFQLEQLQLTNTQYVLDSGYTPYHGEEDLWIPETPVILESLRRMTLVVESRQRYVQDALTLIRAPRLEHLMVDATENDIVTAQWCELEFIWKEALNAFNFAISLKAFLQHSGQYLTTLKLLGISMSDVDLLQSLQHIEALRTLVVGDTEHSLESVYPVTDQLIIGLTTKSPLLLPWLAEAEFSSAARNPSIPCQSCCLAMSRSRNSDIFRSLSVLVPRVVSSHNEPLLE